MKVKFILLNLLLFLSFEAARAQQKVTVKEYNKVFNTYPFSDPDPIPEIGKIYPYFRFDGYTNTPIEKRWKVIELENEYIKVLILPEIGGKIWTAIEKSSGQAFIYNNSVVKFRDVAMRGPWTSGGIEANYGIIGHTPNVATPVDYEIIERDNGSVSCVIGSLDLLTRSTWRLDINLEKDKAFFSTNSFWYNASPIEQPYYSWMNAGIKADGNLQFIFPGTRHIGHNGEYGSWPIDDATGKDISYYKNNNFGGPKSYHIIGKHADFFGNFWHDDNFGMGRYSTRNDKPGKKIWIWGLSRQGMIWEKLLTDTDGQYVEVQSGRLFNQESPGSTFTPFKHRGFAPHSTDLWSEIWFPIVKTRGLVAANDYGALNIKHEDGWLKVYFSPLQVINEDLTIKVQNDVLYKRNLKLNTLQLFTDSIRVSSLPSEWIATLGETKLVYNSSPSADVLSRPVDSPEDFDWKSAYGLYVLGKEDIKQRFYLQAESKLRECLQKDPNYSPALADLSMLLYRRMQYVEALTFVRRALSLNTYDESANYYYGLINLELGNIADAKDGFDIAAMGTTYRVPAYTFLSKLHMKKGDYLRSAEYANKAIAFNKYAIDAYQHLAVNYRLMNRNEDARRTLDILLKLEPLNHFARFEKYQILKNEESKKGFTGLIRNEMPHETYLELAIWYHSLGRNDEAKELLDLAPPGTMVSYWEAYLSKKPLNSSDKNADFVFPFRPESARMLEELGKTNKAWQLKYHLALLHWNFNNIDQVRKLFAEIGDEPKYAPYYAARAKLNGLDKDHDKGSVLADLSKAAALDSRQWRHGENLIKFYIANNKNKEALQTSTRYLRNFKDNFVLGFLHAKSLLLNKDYVAAKKILEEIEILPNEGATGGRELYKETLLKLALVEMSKGKHEEAIALISAARIWPENLGVGKPYEEDIDERLEDWLAYNVYRKLGDEGEAGKMLQKIVAYKYFNSQNKKIRPTANNLISALALRNLNKADEAEKLLNTWLNQDPNNATANWAIRAFRGEDIGKPRVNNPDVNFRVLMEAEAVTMLKVQG